MAGKPSTKKRPEETDRSWAKDVLNLQFRVLARGADYAQRLGDLVGQGATEPRPYVKELFGFWSGVLSDIGDALKGAPTVDPDTLVVSRTYFQMRPERGDIPFAVPSEVFAIHGTKAVITLGTDGLVRTYDPENPYRPAVTLLPEQHLRIHPATVTWSTRKRAALKVFTAERLVQPGDVYEGVIWGAVNTGPGKPTEARAERFPVAMLEVVIV